MVERRSSGLELLQRQVKRRRRVERVAALVGVAGLLVMTAICNRVLRNSADGEPVAIKTMADLSRITGLTFPASSMLREGVYRKGWHDQILAVVTMPRAATARFLAQPQLDQIEGVTADAEREKASLADPRNVQGAPSSWDVHSVHNFHVARWEMSRPPKGYTAGVGSVLVGLDDPYRARVYLCFWGD